MQAPDLNSFLMRHNEAEASKIFLDNVRALAWGSFVHTGGSGRPQWESFNKGMEQIVRYYDEQMKIFGKDRGYKDA